MMTVLGSMLAFLHSSIKYRAIVCSKKKLIFSVLSIELDCEYYDVE